MDLGRPIKNLDQAESVCYGDHRIMNPRPRFNVPRIDYKSTTQISLSRNVSSDLIQNVNVEINDPRPLSTT
jgi:hypothetical protein